MRTRSRGHDIHYETRGNGPALLLIHGTLQSSRRWIGCGYPDELAGSFHLVMPDLLGHGNSDKPHEPDEYTLDGLVTDLVAVLDAEDVHDVYVWGYSGGAALAAALAARHPERVASLVVGGIPPNVSGDVRRAVFQPWIDALRASDWELFWQRFLPVSEETKQLLQRENDPVAVAAFVDGLVDTTPTFSRLATPTLCYEGTSEVFFDLAEVTAHEMGAAFVAIDGLGHDAAFQQLDAIAPTVREFLSRSMAPTPIVDPERGCSSPRNTPWKDAAMTTERLEVQRTIPTDPATIFRLLCDPQGHVSIDSSGMLQAATGEPVTAAGDSFVVHMDREALNDYPLGEYDVTVTITTFVPDREIAWKPEGQIKPQIGHVYGYTLEPVDGGTLVTSYYDWSDIDPVWRDAGIFPVMSEGALRATLGILSRTVAPGVTGAAG